MKGPAMSSNDPNSIFPTPDRPLASASLAAGGPVSAYMGRSGQGSPGAAKIAWIVLIVCTIGVVFMRQWGDDMLSNWLAPSPVSGPASNPVATKRTVKDGSVQRASEDLFPSHPIEDMQLRLMLRISEVGQSRTQAKDELEKTIRARKTSEVGIVHASIVLASLVQRYPADFKIGVAAAFDDAFVRVSNPDLIQDIQTAQAILSAGSVANANVTEQEVRLLKKRQGIFGELAAAVGDPAKREWRDALFTGGWVIGIGTLLAALVFFVVFMTGLVLLIVKLVGRSPSTGIAHTPPAPGGSIPIELAATFIAGFLAFHILAIVVRTQIHEDWVIGALFIGQWSLALVIFYPLLRGMSWKAAREVLGLTSGRGVLNEIAAGVVAYVRFFPIFIAVFATTLLLASLIPGLSEGSPGENAIGPLTTVPAWVIFSIALLGVVWAPLVEEITMRGALFTQLRAHFGLVLSLFVSAAVFALLHQYPPIFLLPVFSLGICFALMRNERTSLIASITAHALHNGTLFGLLICFFGFVLRGGDAPP